MLAVLQEAVARACVVGNGAKFRKDAGTLCIVKEEQIKLLAILRKNEQEIRFFLSLTIFPNINIHQHYVTIILKLNSSLP